MKDELTEYLAGIADPDEKLEAIAELRKVLHEQCPIKQPIDNVLWVDVDMVDPNDYNPNAVASKEMQLLYTSIKQDGYTQPVVTIYDEKKGKYVIIDGFHRYFTCKTQKDIRARNRGRLPIVVLNKDINERMAATVRHNRARGKHSITGMSNMVYQMLKGGMSDAEICNNLGMEVEELLRLKHITGFSKLFANVEYSASWKSNKQIKFEKEQA